MSKSTLSLAIALAIAGLSYGQVATEPTSPAADRNQATTQQSQQAQQNAAQRQTLPGQSVDQQRLEQHESQTHESQTHLQQQQHSAAYRAGTPASMHGRSHRLSEIMSANVYNAENEDLGSIEDVVIDAESGKIRYAAISVGGFLGIGDKLVAVPWEQLRIQPAGDDPDEIRIVLNVNKERIESAPGFDSDNWPDFARGEFSGQVDRYYGVRRETEMSTRPGADPRTDRRFEAQGTQGTQGSQRLDTQRGQGAGSTQPSQGTQNQPGASDASRANNASGLDRQTPSSNR